MDKLITIKKAADEVGAKDWQVRRAVRRGLIPYFTPFSTRKLGRVGIHFELMTAAAR